MQSSQGLTLEMPSLVDVQLSACSPVEVVPGGVAPPPGPQVAASAWIRVSEPTRCSSNVKALPTCSEQHHE